MIEKIEKDIEIEKDEDSTKIVFYLPTQTNPKPNMPKKVVIHKSQSFQDILASAISNGINIILNPS